MKLGRMLFGLLGGLTFGMLFAPKKGKELRKAILKKSDEPVEALKIIGNALFDAGSEAYEEFLKLSEHEQVKALKTLSKEKMNEFLEKAREKGYEVAGQVQEKAEEALDYLKEEMECGSKKRK